MINKKILCLLIGGLIASPSVVNAQSEMTAVKLVNAEESNGSARYQALGGAMGAVGVDFSSVAQNPAALALLRRHSRIDLTMGYTFSNGQSQWYGTKSNSDNNALNFDQLSASFKIGKGTSAWTFGIGLRNTGRSHQVIDASADEISSYKGSSLADYAAASFNNLGNDRQAIFDDFNATKDKFSCPWLPTLGIKADWLAFTPEEVVDSGQKNPDGSPIMKKYPAKFLSNYIYDDAQGTPVAAYPNSVGLIYDEDYYIREADFDLAFSLNKQIHLGFLIATSSLDYTLNSSYSEGFRKSADGRGYDGLSLDNYQSIQGIGAKFGMGIVAEPIKGLRLGASIYTPTYYKFDFNFSAKATGHSPIKMGKDTQIPTPNDAATTFNLNTPWRFGLSAAYIIKRYGLISLDYEYSTFSGARLHNDDSSWDNNDDSFSLENQALKRHFKGMHRLRIGTEFNVSKRLALRAGYSLESNPVDQKLRDGGGNILSEVLVAGTAVHYALPDGRSAYSFGLGYRITPAWSVDFAYVHKAQYSNIYAFPIIQDTADNTWFKGLKSIRQTDRQNRLLLTLGFRF